MPEAIRRPKPLSLLRVKRERSKEGLLFCICLACYFPSPLPTPPNPRRTSSQANVQNRATGDIPENRGLHTSLSLVDTSPDLRAQDISFENPGLQLPTVAKISVSFHPSAAPRDVQRVAPKSKILGSPPQLVQWTLPPGGPGTPHFLNATGSPTPTTLTPSCHYHSAKDRKYFRKAVLPTPPIPKAGPMRQIRIATDGM